MQQLPQEPNRFNQTTDRGVNNVSITEHNHPQTAPFLPILLPLSTWSRWPMRWLGFFALGTMLPSLYVTLPPIMALALTISLLIGILMLIGWASWQRHHFIPAGVAIGITLLGFFFSLFTLIHGAIHHEPGTTTQPISETSIDT